MDYQDVFVEFWEHVKESAKADRFAKLTMAKTIGKPNLRNIFLRPAQTSEGFRVLLKLRYRSRETEDEETEVTLDEAYEVVKSHLRKSFFSVVLFTTTKDISFKINKKGAGSITESAPTFNEVRLAQKDDE